MKHPILALLATLLHLSLLSQDTITLRHRAYSTTFDRTKHYPVKVEWWVTRRAITCTDRIKRSDRFSPDPLLPKSTDLQTDYSNSGFDRGHNFPSADAACDQLSNDESFYFSNMTAQHPSLNRGDWKALESFVRDLSIKSDSVKVWCGSVGEVAKAGRVSVPKKCWKVIYVKATKEWYAYVFDNDSSKPNGLEDNKTTVIAVQKLSGFKFKL